MAIDEKEWREEGGAGKSDGLDLVLMCDICISYVCHEEASHAR